VVVALRCNGSLRQASGSTRARCSRAALARSSPVDHEALDTLAGQHGELADAARRGQVDLREVPAGDFIPAVTQVAGPAVR
jgi:hypothetical protein